MQVWYCTTNRVLWVGNFISLRQDKRIIRGNDGRVARIFWSDMIRCEKDKRNNNCKTINNDCNASEGRK
jgi:hypothetical protein